MAHVHLPHQLHWYDVDWASAVWWILGLAIFAIILLALMGIGNGFDPVSLPAEYTSPSA